MIAEPGSEQKLHQEYDEAERCAIGRDPRTMTVPELNATGHYKRPLLAVIRENCIECGGGNQAEVRRCDMVHCPFWPYRMSATPWHRHDLSNEERERRRERAKKLSAQRMNTSETPDGVPAGIPAPAVSEPAENA